MMPASLLFLALVSPQAPPPVPPEPPAPPLSFGRVQGSEPIESSGGLGPDSSSIPSIDLPLLSPRAELVREDCKTELRHREVTLFGSGTIRLRDGYFGAEATGLYNLSPQELTAYLNRLVGEDLSQVGRLERGIEGDWISVCEVTVELPGQAKQVFTFGQWVSLPLNFSRFMKIVDELIEKVPDIKLAERLDDDFTAQRGDILRRFDGALFRVVGFTSDGRGVELEGQDIPLALYFSPEQVRHDFVALVERDGHKL